jgi:sigma-B regulation protein RsbU (phosphoserine phosphatase)
MENESYDSGRVALQPDDSIVLYTDGITEAANSRLELLGAARLEAALAQCLGRSPKASVELLLERVRAYAGDTEQSDDIAVLVLTYRGPARA